MGSNRRAGGEETVVSTPSPGLQPIKLTPQRRGFIRLIGVEHGTQAKSREKMLLNINIVRFECSLLVGEPGGSLPLEQSCWHSRVDTRSSDCASVRLFARVFAPLSGSFGCQSGSPVVGGLVL